MAPSTQRFAQSLVLTGPTGSGKSAVALELAERWNLEIVAMDSMTLYRGMDIGTAKPSVEERARVPHHLIDSLDPWEAGSVAWWLEKAAEAVQDIESRGKRALFVGGTPLYFKALLFGLFESPTVDPAIRAKWEAEAVILGKEELHRRLAGVDPIAAGKLHPNDVRRVVRALEVFDATGQPLSSFQYSWKEPPTPIRAVVLEWPREVLYQRIDQRVEAMLATGWLDEAKRLEHLPQAMSKEAAQALGYPELREHLRGERSWPESVELIQLRTRQFAKRQLTWFRGLKMLEWVKADEPSLAERVEEILLE